MSAVYVTHFGVLCYGNPEIFRHPIWKRGLREAISRPGSRSPSVLSVPQVSWGGLEQVISHFPALFPEESAHCPVRTHTSSAWLDLITFKGSPNQL